MGQWLYDHLGNLVYGGIAALVVLLLALLSWGITMGSALEAMIAGSILAIVIVLGASVLLVPDDQRPQYTERTLQMASSTLDHLRNGLTPEGCNAVCQLLLPETSAQAVSITDTSYVLSYVGERAPDYPPGSNISRSTKEVLRSRRMETFSTRDAVASREEGLGITTSANDVEGFPVGIIVPLVVADRAVGTLKLYYRSGRHIDRTQLTIARGMATLLSAQLSAYELDRQAELAAQAEVKALQAQINPHFLFNTLNTIAAFTRTDPTRARDLLREFSVFYRQTLEGSESEILLSQELEQTRRYLTIEQARFGEDRIIETEHLEPGLGDVLVPAFLVQPIVENAVRHAMRDEGPLHIDVHVASDGADVMVAVADDGMGMTSEVADRLLAEPDKPHGSGGGTGIALRNVAERIELFYGAGSGIEIMSKPGAGTVVTLRLADAVQG